MKQLLLMRHAKSSWKDPALADFDRPLNRRGRRDAPRAGQVLAERNALPDLIVASSARRAVQTAEAVARACGGEAEVQTTRALYAAPPEAYVETAWEVPDDVQRLLLVGHNPGLARLLFELTGTSADVPTSALACITLDMASWDRMTLDTPAQLQWLWYPKLESE